MEDDLDVMEAVLLDDTMAIECMGMAIECDFQALTLTEGQNMIRAHEAQSHKTLKGQGRPRALKPPAPLTERMPIGMDVSPHHFEKGARSDRWMHHQCQKPLDHNNSALSQQLLRSMRSLWYRDASQSGYYSEDSDLDSALMMSVVTSNTSAHEEWQTGGTFDRCINRKVALPKLNDESSTNDQWIWLADVHHYIDSGCSMSILESEIDKSLSNGFWGVWF